MIVFGGSSPITGPMNDVYTLDVSGLWHQLAGGGALVFSVCVVCVVSVWCLCGVCGVCGACVLLLLLLLLLLAAC